jgi:hypothetical protein
MGPKTVAMDASQGATPRAAPTPTLYDARSRRGS